MLPLESLLRQSNFQLTLFWPNFRFQVVTLLTIHMTQISVLLVSILMSVQKIQMVFIEIDAIRWHHAIIMKVPIHVPALTVMKEMAVGYMVALI